MAPARTILDELRDLAALIREAGGAEVHMRDADVIRRAIAAQAAAIVALRTVAAALPEDGLYPDDVRFAMTTVRAAIAKAEGK